MHVMQYEITLPADYDMGVIDRRVAGRGAATDDFPHLTDFGRPAVRHWIGAAFHRGPAFAAVPVFATRELWPLPADDVPGPALEPALAPVRHAATVHSEAVAVDPDRWEVARFTLWSAVPDALDPAWTCFDVLHASTPRLGDLATGTLR